MVDNFELIGKHIEQCYGTMSQDDAKDAYFHLQIIKRKKDTGEGSNSVCLRAYQIDADHPLSKYRDDIIALCEYFKARAYINPSPKSKEGTAVEMLKRLADCFRLKDFNHVNRVWNSSAGSVGAMPSHKLWVVDYDYPDGFDAPWEVSDLLNCIENECQPTDKKKCVMRVPTRKGVHLITRPFDLRTFFAKFPGVDVHKNNPTVLYVPAVLDTNTDKDENAERL